MEGWLTAYEELLWQRFSKKLTDQGALDYWVNEWQGAGLSVDQERAWLEAGVHPTCPQPAGDLHAAGIPPKTAFQPIRNQGQETSLTIYRLVSAGQWTIQDALDLIGRGHSAKAS